MSNYIDIDGSVLEGGGQILRMSVAFSALLGVPVNISKIRAGRSKPGLAAQHCKGIQLVADMCRAKTSGVQIGSTEISFAPGKICGGHYVADIQTAGSISLLLQVALPCALMADGPVVLDLKGGTNAAMAPQVDYMTEIFRPLLEKFGGTFDFDLHRRGYFPRGGGHVTVSVKPLRSIRSIDVTEFGQVDRIYGWSFVAGTLPMKLAYEMADGAKSVLTEFTTNINIECYKEDRDIARDNCSGIILAASTNTTCILGSDALGSRGTEARGLGTRAGDELAAGLRAGASVDEHAQDQIIILMALAEGTSRCRVGDVTLHTQTAIHVATMHAKVKFEIIPEGNTNIIECTGMGYHNTRLPR